MQSQRCAARSVESGPQRRASAALYSPRDRRKARKTKPAETIQPGRLDDETTRLADAILALDDRFAAGKIDQAAYRQQRAQLKEQLKSLL